MTFGAGFGFPRARFPMGAAPTLSMDFAGTAALPPYVTFSRGTNATYVDSLGNIAYAPSNLLTYSEQFDNAAWVKTNSTVTANTIAAPDGSLTADKLVPTTATSTHYVFQSVSSTVGTTYTYSTYLKQGEYRYGRIERGNDGAGAFFDLQTGTVGGTNGLIVSSAITSVGNGWYRCSIVVVAATSSMFFVVVSGNNVADIATFTGDGTSGIYIWGAQLNLDGLQPYNSTTVKNLLGYTQDFDNAAWTKSNSSITQNVITAPDGSLTADKLVEDTATGFHRVVPAASSTVVAGGVITTSVYAKQEGRTAIAVYPYSSAAGANFNLATGTVISTSGGVTAQIVDVGNGWYRCSASIVAPATSAAPWILPLGPANATSYTGDGTSGVYIWGAQLSDSASLDPYSYNFTTAPTAAAYYGPRFDYDPTTLACKGLLIEEQRTNSIRNNTMQGAVVGTPGTTPTNWAASSASGLAREVVGTGSVGGVTYIDVRIFGTTTNTSLALNLRFENATQIIAIPGQVWSESVWVQVIGGSTAGVAYAYLTVVELSSAGVDLAYLSGSTFLPTINTFIRRTHSITTSNAATAFVCPTLWLGQAGIGAAIDITLRIGLPQLELGAFATSVIPTTTTAVTRAADVAVIQGANFSNWYNQSEGTIYGEFDVIGYALSSAFPSTMVFSDGTNSNRILIANANTGSNLYPFYEIYTGGVSQVGVTSVSFDAGALRRVAGAYAANDFAFTTQGLAAQTDLAGLVPTVNRFNIGTNALGTGSFLNGHIARIAYYSTRQPNATLQAITT